MIGQISFSKVVRSAPAQACGVRYFLNPLLIIFNFFSSRLNIWHWVSLVELFGRVLRENLHFAEVADAGGSTPFCKNLLCEKILRGPIGCNPDDDIIHEGGSLKKYEMRPPDAVWQSASRE